MDKRVTYKKIKIIEKMLNFIDILKNQFIICAIIRKEESSITKNSGLFFSIDPSILSYLIVRF